MAFNAPSDVWSEVMTMSASDRFHRTPRTHMRKTASRLIDAFKPIWTQYKNAWSTSPKITGAKHIAGLGFIGGLAGLGYSANSNEISKAQEERPIGDINWGKPNPKEDWLDRSANFVRKYNPFVALTADRALSHSTPSKVDYDKQGWFAENFPGTSEFFGAYGRHLNGWATMLERGGRRALSEFGQGYATVGYTLPALLSGGMIAVGGIFGNRTLRNSGGKLRSWTLANRENAYNEWEDYADNSYSKDNYSGIAPEVYQSFRSLEIPTAVATNAITTGAGTAAAARGGKLGSLAASAVTLDDYGSAAGFGFMAAADKTEQDRKLDKLEQLGPPPMWPRPIRSRGRQVTEIR